MTVLDLAKVVVLPITGCAVLVVILNPAGPVHTVVTVTGMSTAGFNSTVQVRVTADPTGRIGLTGELVTVTDERGGTNEKEAIIDN